MNEIIFQKEKFGVAIHSSLVKYTKLVNEMIPTIHKANLDGSNGFKTNLDVYKNAIVGKYRLNPKKAIPPSSTLFVQDGGEKAYVLMKKIKNKSKTNINSNTIIMLSTD
jgi:hypothetical protein